MYTWNLEKLYRQLNDEDFKKDSLALEATIDDLLIKAKHLSKGDVKSSLIDFLKQYEDLQLLSSKLGGFVQLSLSTDSTNESFNNAMVVLQQKLVKTTLPLTLFEKFVASVDNLEEIINSDSFLKEYEFMLKEIKNESIHLLTDDEEVLAAQLNQSGGSLFSKMQTVLTSTLEVDYDGKVINLSKVRNLAYDSNPETRKKAYLAEKESYKKIAKSSSFALNGIKKEVTTMSKARKYNSPLERTLLDSRLSKDVLDALITAMKQYLPDFRRYLHRKGEVLGHKNGLPFFDLFAPMGSSDKKYTIEEAQAFILKNFGTFSDDLKVLAQRAFTEDWIDYEPRPGKSGGAFCSRIYPLKESRILTNFDGGIGDISTIAHELGHAYHNSVVFNERLFNSNYPMPIAETASILCETIVKKAAFKEAKSNDEKLGMIEQELQDSTQVIVDILSRYIFETNVFERCQSEFLNESTLNKLMLEAQKETYGDGLNPEFLNEGMWINKGHYYSTSRSFYNFPYAFGLLFAKGIYGKYQEKGSAFVDDLRKLLRMTGKASLVDVAKTINIDITDVAFWKSSLEIIKTDIDTFIELTK
jgi:pepF/M3 family oligoendopeptidase